MKYFLKINLLILFLLLAGSSLQAQDSKPSSEIVRFGFINTIMGDVNENDVRAAIRIWTQSLTRELDIPAKPAILIYPAISQIKKDLEENRVDVLYITTPQLFTVRHLMAEDALFAIEQSGSATEEYLLLVHQDSPVKEVGDLKGREVRILENPRTAMGLNWLAALLAEKGLGRPEAHFKQVNIVKKINKAVLPVFFKQTDACLVSRKGFDTMTELNPQISRTVRVLAASEPYIPAIFSFRKTYQSRVKQIFLKDMQKMVNSTSGGQLLTIFQMDGLQQLSMDDLADSFSLLEKNQHLFRQTVSGKNKETDQ